MVRRRTIWRSSMPGEKKIYRSLRKAQARHAYFLLTAAGGGIALASSRGAVLAWANIAIELAVVAWALSFFCGCRYVDFVLSELYLDHQSESVQSGEYPEIGDNPALVTLAEKRIRHAMRGNCEGMSFFAAWQFRLLIAGGMLYVAWFIILN